MDCKRRTEFLDHPLNRANHLELVALADPAKSLVPLCLSPQQQMENHQ
jgi:hypothetical protein